MINTTLAKINFLVHVHSSCNCMYFYFGFSSGPEVIKLFLYTTQLSMEFQLLIKSIMLKKRIPLGSD